MNNESGLADTNGAEIGRVPNESRPLSANVKDILPSYSVRGGCSSPQKVVFYLLSNALSTKR